MTRSVTLIHTVSSLIEPFTDLANELLPETDVFHILDESLLTLTRRLGHITPQIRRRLLAHATSADDQGVSAILVTCSSVGSVVEVIRPFITAPILRVDDAMADHAIALGMRIGILATLSSTLEPTRQLIASRAIERGAELTIRAVVCDGAFEALSLGDVKRHDDLVRTGLVSLAADSDVVVLAQASMARALADVSLAIPIPILSSPRLAMERLALVLAQQDA